MLAATVRAQSIVLRGGVVSTTVMSQCSTMVRAQHRDRTYGNAKGSELCELHSAQTMAAT